MIKAMMQFEMEVEDDSEGLIYAQFRKIVEMMPFKSASLYKPEGIIFSTGSAPKLTEASKETKSAQWRQAFRQYLTIALMRNSDLKAARIRALEMVDEEEREFGPL